MCVCVYIYIYICICVYIYIYIYIYIPKKFTYHMTHSCVFALLLRSYIRLINIYGKRAGRGYYPPEWRSINMDLPVGWLILSWCDDRFGGFPWQQAHFHTGVPSNCVDGLITSDAQLRKQNFIQFSHPVNIAWMVNIPKQFLEKGKSSYQSVVMSTKPSVFNAYIKPIFQ